MKLTVIGTGYVGLVAGACFAKFGNEVHCVDKDPRKLAILREGKSPFYEPGLGEILTACLRERRIFFTDDLLSVMPGTDVCLIAVGTPTDCSGCAADLQYVEAAAREIGACMNEYKLVVTKSTVPVGTAEKIRKVIQEELDRRGVQIPFDVASNPEFLREGAAIRDFLEPDRLVFGVDSDRAARILYHLYSFIPQERLFKMDIPSAEMTKYAANAMLALRISFMNEIAQICERTGADVENVRMGVGTDSRIGDQFLRAGCGFGGSCFPKDVRALQDFARDAGYESRILAAVEHVNEKQKEILYDKLEQHFGSLAGKKIAIWGLSFKPKTSDVREAPSLVLIHKLLEQGATVQVHDPEAMDEARLALGDIPGITYVEQHFDALNGADALVLVTEWDIYRQPDFNRVRSMLSTPVIVDGRNLYLPEELIGLGFYYYGIGRQLNRSV